MESTLRSSLASTLGCTLDPGAGLPYVKSDRALDLGNLGATTVPDRSGNANDATLKTGRFVTTDGASSYIVLPVVGSVDSLEIGFFVRSSVGGTQTFRFAIRNGGSEASYFAVAKTLTLTANQWTPVLVGVYTIGGGVMDFDEIWLGVDAAGNYGAFDISDAKVWGDEFLLARYQLNEHDDPDANGLHGKPCFDSGGNDFRGSYVGCHVHGGEPEILQLAGMDWNQGATLDDTISLTETDLDFGSRATVTTGVDGVQGLDDWVSAYANNENNSHYFATFSGHEFEAGKWYRATLRVYIPSSNTHCDGLDIRLGDRSEAGGDVVVGHSAITVTGSIQDVDYTWYQDGNDDDSRIYLTSGGNLSFQGAGSPADDIVYVRELEVAEVYPSTFTIPEDESNPGFDVTGNAIARPRPNDQTLNLPADGYVEIADADSLDLVNDFTLEAWANLYGVPSVDTDILQKGADWEYLMKLSTQAADRVYTDFRPASSSIQSIEASNDEFACYHIIKDSAVGSPLYVNNVLKNAGTLGTANLTPNNDPLIIRGADGMHVQIGGLKLYDAVLTGEQRQQNFNSQKSKYGL